MKFQNGHKMSTQEAAAAKTGKPMSDALKYIMNQPIEGKRLRVPLPPKPTVVQVAAAHMWQEAIRGNVSAWESIANRIEGRVKDTNAMFEGMDEQDQEMTIAEAARVIGFILVRQAHECNKAKPH